MNNNNTKKFNRGVSSVGCSTPKSKKRSQMVINRGKSDNYSNQSLLSEKSGVQIVDPGQWLLWCEENHVVGSKSTNKVILEHHEIECFKRYFNQMKNSIEDVGVHPHILADSLLASEIFPTLNESLQFAQKLREESNLLVTYSDITKTMQCQNNYKRNKIRSYIKYISSLEVSKIASGNINVDGNGSGNDGAVITPTKIEDIPSQLQVQSQISTQSEANIEYNNNPSSPTFTFSLSSPTSVTQSFHFSEKSGCCNTASTIMTVDSENENNEQKSSALDSIKENMNSTSLEQLPPQSISSQSSNNFISNTISQFVTNATERLSAIFEKPSTTTLNSRLSKPSYHHQDSDDSSKSFISIKQYFSRSKSHSPIPSLCESIHENNINELTLTAITTRNEIQSSPPFQSISPKLSPKTSPKLSQTKMKIRPVLKKLDSGESKIRPAVRFKRASMKIYVANQLIHTFTSNKSRIAVELNHSSSNNLSSNDIQAISQS